MRAVVVLEHKVDRLEAEARGVEWRDPVAVPSARMAGIRRDQKQAVQRRVDAMTSALLHFAEQRVVPGRIELAAKVSAELGETFSQSSLYRKPYDTMWKEGAAIHAPHVADDAATTADRSRWSRRELVHRLRRLEPRHDELLAARRAALVEQSDTEGWTVIPDHPRDQAA